MDNFRDRLAGRDRGGRDRYDRGMDRDRSDRGDRYDRDDMDERSSRRAPSYGGDVQIDDIANAVEQSNSKQLEVIADCLDDVKDEVYASEKEILKAIDQIADAVDSGRNQRAAAPAPTPALPAIDPAVKEEILSAVFGNTNILNSIREMLDKKEQEAKAVEEAQAEAPAEAAEAPADPIKTTISEFYNNMEDHVHKENVKCYRNVQAALSEQGEQIIDKNRKSLGFLKVFAIVNLVLTVVNIALLVCFVFGII